MPQLSLLYPKQMQTYHLLKPKGCKRVFCYPVRKCIQLRCAGMLCRICSTGTSHLAVFANPASHAGGCCLP